MRGKATGLSRRTTKHEMRLKIQLFPGPDSQLDISGEVHHGLGSNDYEVSEGHSSTELHVGIMEGDTKLALDQARCQTSIVPLKHVCAAICASILCIGVKVHEVMPCHTKSAATEVCLRTICGVTILRQGSQKTLHLGSDCIIGASSHGQRRQCWLTVWASHNLAGVGNGLWGRRWALVQAAQCALETILSGDEPGLSKHLKPHGLTSGELPDVPCCWTCGVRYTTAVSRLGVAHAARGSLCLEYGQILHRKASPPAAVRAPLGNVNAAEHVRVVGVDRCQDISSEWPGAAVGLIGSSQFLLALHVLCEHETEIRVKHHDLACDALVIRCRALLPLVLLRVPIYGALRHPAMRNHFNEV
mmetsp:Transcript_21616/g.47794  ORF Transcript_21616/g.47794 Transcript_21616/m.47794 type:complete len:359 (-) Transcript_21616:1581-2657(-)